VVGTTRELRVDTQIQLNVVRQREEKEINRGVRYLTGENLKVVWAEFSTLS